MDLTTLFDKDSEVELNFTCALPLIETQSPCTLESRMANNGSLDLTAQRSETPEVVSWISEFRSTFRRRKTGKKKFECDMCRKPCHTRQDLERHRASKHQKATVYYHCSTQFCRYSSTSWQPRQCIREDQMKDHIKNYGHYGPHSPNRKKRQKEHQMTIAESKSTLEINVIYEAWEIRMDRPVRTLIHTTLKTGLTFEDIADKQYLMHSNLSLLSNSNFCSKEGCYFNKDPPEGLCHLSFSTLEYLHQHQRRADHISPDLVGKSEHLSHIQSSNIRSAFDLFGDMDIPSGTEYNTISKCEVEPAGLQSNSSRSRLPLDPISLQKVGGHRCGLPSGADQCSNTPEEALLALKDATNGVKTLQAPHGALISEGLPLTRVDAREDRTLTSAFSWQSCSIGFDFGASHIDPAVCDPLSWLPSYDQSTNPIMESRTWPSATPSSACLEAVASCDSGSSLAWEWPLKERADFTMQMEGPFSEAKILSDSSINFTITSTSDNPSPSSVTASQVDLYPWPRPQDEVERSAPDPDSMSVPLAFLYISAVLNNILTMSL